VIASPASRARPGRRSRPCRSRCAGRCSVRSFTCWTRRSPTLADPFPRDAPLPGAYELHLPADDVTIWYTVTDHEGQEVISVQHVSLDT
jgi:hypothetical protein